MSSNTLNKEETLRKILELNQFRMKYHNSISKLQRIISKVYSKALDSKNVQQIKGIEMLFSESVNIENIDTILDQFENFLNDYDIDINDSNEVNDAFISVVTDNLRSLVRNLPVDDTRLKIINHKINKITESKDLTGVPDLITEISSIINDSNDRMTDAFGNFLDMIDSKMNIFHEDFVEIDNTNQNFYAQTTKIKDMINKKLTSIKSSDSDNSLEDSISMLIKGVNHYQESINKQIESQAQKNNELINRIKEIEQENKQIKEVIKNEQERRTIDYLTNIQNREGFIKKVNSILENYESYNAYLAMMDIDNFKKLNDTFGHIAGDRVLRIVAELVKNELDDNSFIYRIGGEEFGIIIKNVEREASLLLVEKIRMKINNTLFTFKDVRVEVSVSIGLTQVEATDTIDTLVDRADQLMYQSKKTGKNMTIHDLLFDKIK